MLNKFIGKKVDVIVAFSTTTAGGNLSPVAYAGVLQAVDEEGCILSLAARRTVMFATNNPLGINADYNRAESCSGNMYIRKEYIISCCEMN